LIRYADDFVIGTIHESDARRIMEVLPKRMSKYGLTVHPEKTRLIRFQPERSAETAEEAGDDPEPRTFDFLGFTHYWGRSRRGGWVIKRKTAKGRWKRALHSLSEWCRANRHQPLAEQHQRLSEKLRGHYAYYGIIGNFASLRSFLHGTRRTWRRWLCRRGQGGPLTWPEFVRLEDRYRLPGARVVHGLARGAAPS
jgi:RNA-directed DNA polymerase